MNKFTNYFVIAAVLISLIVQSLSAVAQEKNMGPIEKLKWLESADAQADARKAILNRDYRLRAVYGYSLVVPGTEKKNCLNTRQGSA